MNTPFEIVMFMLSLLALAGGIGFFVSRYHRRYLIRILKDAGSVGPNPEVEIERIRAKDRAESRALYERVVRDKLDVIKTALTMGYDKQDLKQLDERLEQLIGMEQLTALLKDTPAPLSPPEQQLLDTDLGREIENLRRRPEQQQY